MFSAKLNAAVSTVASGITMRGKFILRTRFSRLTTAWTEFCVASEKNVNSTMFSSSTMG